MRLSFSFWLSWLTLIVRFATVRSHQALLAKEHDP
jgi:hypothetical protein